MKKYAKLLALLLALAMVFGMLAGCAKDNTTPSTDDTIEPEATTIELDSVADMDEIELDIGDDMDNDLAGEVFDDDDKAFFGDEDDEDDLDSDNGDR